MAYRESEAVVEQIAWQEELSELPNHINGGIHSI